MKFLQKIRKGRKGFTLIELLVVIAILGVIAAVAVPNVLKFMSSGTVEAANSEVATVRTAVAAYMYNDGVPVAPPADSDSLSTLVQNPLKATYTFDADDGHITGVSSSSWGSSISFNATTGMWKK